MRQAESSRDTAVVVVVVVVATTTTAAAAAAVVVVVVTATAATTTTRRRALGERISLTRPSCGKRSILVYLSILGQWRTCLGKQTLVVRRS